MASPTTATVLLFTVIATVLTISATARPCKTIFFITSSSFQNPNNSPRFTFFITEIHRSNDAVSSSSRPFFTDLAVKQSPNDAVSSSSFRDRTMDIMSIVGALLFGAGCGALTAATMYLIWSLCSNRRLDFASDSDEDDVDEYYDVDDDVSPRKNGYVAVKDVPPTADEVDAMK